MAHTIAATVRESHLGLRSRIHTALETLEQHGSRREAIQMFDAFLIDASRHVSAVGELLLPLVSQRLDEGRVAARDYLEQTRRLELVMMLAKRRLYGESTSRGVPWSDVVHHLQSELDRVIDAENQMLDGVLPSLSPVDRLTMGDRLAAAERSAPTRPHPHLPHVGKLAHVARRVYARTDRIWDTLEGRIAAPHA